MRVDLNAQGKSCAVLRRFGEEELELDMFRGYGLSRRGASAMRTGRAGREGFHRRSGRHFTHTTNRFRIEGEFVRSVRLKLKEMKSAHYRSNEGGLRERGVK